MKKLNPSLFFMVAGTLLLSGCSLKESMPLSCETTDSNDLCTNHSSPQSSLTPITSSEEELKEYTNLPSESMIQVLDFESAKTLIESGTGVLAFSFPSCPWCQEALPVLNEVATEFRETPVFYLNVRQLSRGEADTEYEQLAQLLKPYLTPDEDGELVIYVPDVFFIQEGKVIGHHLGTTDDHDAHERQMTAEEVEELKETYFTLFESWATNH